MIYVAAAAALLAFLSTPAVAQLYRCTSADGKTSFMDKPCPPEANWDTGAFGREDERGRAFKRFLEANGVPYRTEPTSGGSETIRWQALGNRDWYAEFSKINPPTSSTIRKLPIDVPRAKPAESKPAAMAESGGRIPGNHNLNVAYCIDGWYQVGSPNGRTRSSVADQEEYAKDCALFGMKTPSPVNDAHNESVFRRLKAEQDERTREQIEKSKQQRK